MNTNTSVKTRGGMYHVLSQLNLKGIIDENYLDNLKRDYNYGRIVGFGHLAEYLAANGTIIHGGNNYHQIINYGRKFGEN
jgi:hypothetical protein